MGKTDKVNKWYLDYIIYSKFSKLSFNSAWTKNFQIFKLALEKAEESESESHLVLSDSLRPHGLYSPWNSSGQNTGVGSLSLL